MRTRTLHVARAAALLAGIIIALPSHAASVSAIWEAEGLTDETLGLTDALLTIKVSYDTEADPIHPPAETASYFPFEVQVTIDDGSSVYNWFQIDFASSGLTVGNDVPEGDQFRDEIHYRGSQLFFPDPTLNGLSLYEVQVASSFDFSDPPDGPLSSTELPNAGLDTSQFDSFTALVRFGPAPNTLPATTAFATPYEFRTTEYVSTVPVPGAIWLFGSALLGLGAWVRRRR